MAYLTKAIHIPSFLPQSEKAIYTGPTKVPIRFNHYPDIELSRIKYNESSAKRAFEEVVEPYLNRPDALNEIYVQSYLKYVRDKSQIYLHISKLSLTLFFYDQITTVNGKAMKSVDYLIYNLLYGPSFAKWLKKVRQAMTIKTLAKRLTNDNKSFIDEVESAGYRFEKKEKYDYDSFLNESYLIDFEEDDSDFDNAFIPVEENKDWLSSFRMAARSLFRTYKIPEIKQPDDDVLATWISDSITPTSDGPMVNRTYLRNLVDSGIDLKSLMLERSQEPFEFKRQVVHVSPANVRDTWQCYPKTLFAIKRLSYISRQVLYKIPYSMICSPLDSIRRKKILKNKKQYFMFDYKKCGLTINRSLLRIIGEELDLVYPNQGFTEYFRWENSIVRNGDVALKPLRGTGLGNCNEGTTLIQCVMGHMFKLRLGIDSIFFNDDGVLVQEEGLIRSTFTFCLQTFKQLGMIVNLKKTIISLSNIFLEDYITPKESLDYTKKQLVYLSLAQCFFTDIASAKSLYYQLYRQLMLRNIEIQILDSLIAYHGIEFHNMEKYLPYEFGGWKYFGTTSVNEVVQSIWDLQSYVGSGNGFIPYMKEWIRYLILSQNVKKFNDNKSQIKYRKFISNPFKNWKSRAFQDENTEKIYRSLGIRTNKEYNDSLDDLYNSRGLHNAKPRVKRGQRNKRLAARKSIWKKFLRFSYKNRRVFEPFTGNLLQVLEYLRREELFPQNYSPPDFMILKSVKPAHPERRGRYFVPDSADIESADRWSLHATVESLHQLCWIKGARPFGLIKELYRSKSRALISPTPLYDPCEHTFIPDWLYLFYTKKKYANYIYFRQKGRCPVFWHDIPEYKRSLEGFINPIKKIFPKSYERFRSIILKNGKDFKKFVDTCLSKVYIHSDAKFNLVFDTIIDLYDNIKSKYDSLQKTIYKDTELEEEILGLPNDDHLAEHLLGEKVEDDLIEEEIFEDDQKSEASVHEDEEYIDYDIPEDDIVFEEDDAELDDYDYDIVDRIALNRLDRPTDE